jgi:hypothetical protein
MNEHDNEQDFLKKVRSSLDAGLEQMDPTIAKRLQESRRRALDLADKRPFRLFSIPRLIPVGGFATLAMAAVAVSFWLSIRPPAFPHKATEDIEVLTVQGNLEMYKDLEFFQMLAQAHETR